MKLWTLFPNDDLPDEENPWIDWYDKAHGFIVRAETEEQARLLVQNSGQTGDEIEDADDIWINPYYSSCVELLQSGDAGIILVDFRNA